jgi:hypothetical protein
MPEENTLTITQRLLYWNYPSSSLKLLISILNTFTVKGATEPVDIKVDSLPD